MTTADPTPEPRRKSVAVPYFKALDDGPEGTFEAIVSVFGNVDHDGEVVTAGAFADTLEEWKASGDPIPVVFSHQWANLDAHVGTVNPADAVELMPGSGDARLAEAGLEDNGGLFVRGQLDLGTDDTPEPFARRLWKRLKSRRIKEWSFGFGLKASSPRDPDEAGFLNLDAVDLFELGPTLKGANPATATLTTKGRDGEAVDHGDLLADLKALEELLEADEGDPSPDDPPAGDTLDGDEDPSGKSSLDGEDEPEGDGVTPTTIHDEALRGLIDLELEDPE